MTNTAQRQRRCGPGRTASATPIGPSQTRAIGGQAAATGPTWPAAELDPRWPHPDTDLAAWRYRRILAAAEERETTYHFQHTARGQGVPPSQWDVLVAVPVSPDWQAAPGQSTIRAYDCVAELLSGTPTDGTVLTVFPLLALRRSIKARLRALGRERQASHEHSAAA